MSNYWAQCRRRHCYIIIISTISPFPPRNCGLWCVGHNMNIEYIINIIIIININMNVYAYSSWWTHVHESISHCSKRPNKPANGFGKKFNWFLSNILLPLLACHSTVKLIREYPKCKNIEKRSAVRVWRRIILLLLLLRRR